MIMEITIYGRLLERIRDRQIRKSAVVTSKAICLNISTYDIQWGTVSVLPTGLLFTVTPKPASVTGK